MRKSGPLGNLILVQSFIGTIGSGDRDVSHRAQQGEPKLSIGVSWNKSWDNETRRDAQAMGE